MIGMAPRVVIVITLRANIKLKSRYWRQFQKTSLWIFSISWLSSVRIVFLLLIMSTGKINSVLFKIWISTQIKVKDWDQAFLIWMCIKGYVLIVVVVICGQLGWVMSWTLFEQMETKYTSALSINTGQHTHTIPKIAKDTRLPDCLWENGFIWRAVKNCSGPSAAVPCDQHGPSRPWLSSWSRSLWSSWNGGEGENFAGINSMAWAAGWELGASVSRGGGGPGQAHRRHHQVIVMVRVA